jgi:hypothetical protein
MLSSCVVAVGIVAKRSLTEANIDLLYAMSKCLNLVYSLNYTAVSKSFADPTENIEKVNEKLPSTFYSTLKP